MNGFGHLPSKIDQNTFVFYANAASSTSGSFQAWQIPDHASFLHFTVIGGGGGGGGGCGGAPLASGRGGGGGGAPAGLVAVSIPAILLPRTLYLQVGYGGTPGTGSNNQAIGGQSGNSGTISYVCLYPEINAGSVLIQSSNTAPGGGQGGFGTVSAGTAVTIADTTNLKWLGIVGNTVAQTAGGGATTAIGSSVTYAGLLTGGAGGGNKQGSSNNGSSGGSQTITSINSYVTTAINGGAGGTNPAAGSDGTSGYFSWRPFIATGGSGGGGGSVSANGGNGGKGAFGCGGGGGGAAGLVGGTGGAGGDGLIIIAIS